VHAPFCVEEQAVEM